MQEITEILQSVRGDIDFTNATNLVSDGIITSFDILQIVMKLEEEFDIEIEPQYIEPENFNSAKAIKEMIEKLKNAN
ncbi:acyl carrier protein [Campylobacter hyointestinalis]|uniref:Acyl carrier protein n=1 Tax=Campylobacter hyointestinalis subsp. lawsonii TaxID=91353 RepID=A0AAV6EEY1_CAMHY|nr:acyl carrier protein [Campylobacter hyointestinalis]KAB0611832.1 acyl carrier protein [Campylobacter hyointestinalis subsp. lawsonii]QKF69027.1 acyl carrier protein [Campylobacter hyointestinalis subsp. lawsonii]RAZ28808.1 acyl carrier protein [Campylobacter hyointestinalis subsp. lawsonii]RAZ40263.1 acyl carrier protein [Campylobacter hyointestinalis subsp. lawsonii]RAZ45842.1 acyl carrier protein [Campylobacter hyointestinalis subsp. lawsonii]